MAAAGPLSVQAGSVEVTLTAAATRDLAFAELQAGHFDKALALTDGLLARDPKDAGALVIRAQALRGLGRLPEAEAAARAAFAAADSMSLHYGAALAMAQILSLENHRTFAQIWLRRANHYATTDDQRARVASDYRFVRAQNPLNLRFDFSVQPSSNVNNGSAHSIWDFFGIPLSLSGDAQALSGLTGDVGVSGSYRLSQTTATYDALTFALSDHEVFLSSAAHQQAPNANNVDYRMPQATLGYQHRDLLGPDGSILTSSLSLGRVWYGSAEHVGHAIPGCTPDLTHTCITTLPSFGALSNTATLSFDLTRPIGPGAENFLHLDLERNARLDKPGSSANIFGLTGGFSQSLQNGDSVKVSAGVSQSNSHDFDVDHTSLSVDFDYALGQPIGGIQWGAALGLQVSDYPDNPYSLTGQRHDLGVNLGVTGVLERISIYGFSPVLSLAVSQSSSNVSLYDTKSYGIGLSFRSRF
jgi:hypothetical protein